jgi:hypothetical protein
MELALPDEPRWVEAHGIARDPASWQRACGGGVAVGSDRARLVVIANAEPGAAVELAATIPDCTILVASQELAAALRNAGRFVERALVHVLPEPELLPELEGAVVLPADAVLAHVPAELVAELRAAAGPVWTAYLDGEPVSFAYAPWRSARYFDISVDTLAPARQLGLGTITASAMIRYERGLGREPVWGADEANHVSLALARRLGFVPVDELWVASPSSNGTPQGVPRTATPV